MPEKTFHSSDVLSVMTGALLSKSGMDGIYKIMGHILGSKDVSTMGIATNAPKARQFLEETMPWVKKVKFPELPADMSREERISFVRDFVRVAADKYGEYHQVGQITDEQNLRPKEEQAYLRSFVKKTRGPRKN